MARTKPTPSQPEQSSTTGTGGELHQQPRRAAFGSLPSSLERVLTQRQQQIVLLLGEGLSNKEIARRLSLGTSTVKNHVHDILDRLQVTSRSEAAARIHRTLHIS
jgi:two-component system, NarL family, nitrate/nitrite response regulator NarL